MGQYFQVHNVDNPTFVPTSMSGKWSEDFWANHYDSDFMRALWLSPKGKRWFSVKSYPSGQSEEKFQLPPVSLSPKPPPTPRLILRYPKESHANAFGNAGSISKLSNEVIASVFACIDGIDDIAVLAMSCQRLFGIGSPFLEQALQKFAPSWAGDRLICLGDESDISKLPRNMLTEREVKFLEGEKLRRCADNGENLSDSSDVENNIYDSEENIYDYLASLWTLNPNFNPRTERERINSRDLDQFFYSLMYRTHYTRDVKVFQKLLDNNGFQYKDLYKSDSPYIFRNLNTREYVRGNAVFNLRQKKKYFDQTCFEHLFYLRATWPANANLHYDYSGSIPSYLGRWAGHRFDMTVIDNSKGEEWKDISDEILAELQEGFESYYY